MTLRALAGVATGAWARLDDTGAGRFLRAFVELRAIDRSLALASPSPLAAPRSKS